MSDLSIGVRAVVQAIGLIVKEPRVRRLAITPMLINVVLILVGGPLSIWLGIVVGRMLIPETSELASALRTVIQVIAAIVVVVVGIFILLVLARIIAAPLMSRLSEMVEIVVLGDRYVPRSTTVRTELADVGRGIGFAIGRLVLFIITYPFILLLGLIPGAGPFLVPICTFLYGAFVLSLDFSEPVFERHLPGFRRRMHHVRSHPMVYIGFGGLAVVMTLIPFANLAVLPVCVSGATIAYINTRHESERV